MNDVHQYPSEQALDLTTLRPYCREKTFAAGDHLRTKGLLSIDMFILVDGEVEVELELKRGGRTEVIVRSGPGVPIGEIGFLTGVPATATVTARIPVHALYLETIDWLRFEREKPREAADCYRQLATVAEGRLSYNLAFAGVATKADAPERASEVRLCQTPALLEEAQRLRYEVYCDELGRVSPYADPVRRIISDPLDETASVLLAFEEGVSVATMRLNRASHGNLGLLEDLYGMEQSEHHPKATAICTKFIVRKNSRLGKSSFYLMANALDLARRYGIKHCFIDCVPQLRPFYAGMGFAQSAPPFLHRENGRSFPMMLDIDRYGGRVARLTGFALR